MCDLALIRRKILPMTLISGTIWCWNISSQEIWALSSAPLTLTIKSESLPTPCHCHHRNDPVLERPSALNNMKRDWSEKRTVLQCARLNQIYLWPHRSHSARWCAMTEREREMFYLTTHSTHFIYGYMASDIWLRTILIMRKETRCRHIGYSYRLTASVLLYAPSHRQDSTYHGLCYTSRGHWLEREIAQWVHPMKDRSDDPSHHERTLYLWATSRSDVPWEHCVAQVALLQDQSDIDDW